MDGGWLPETATAMAHLLQQGRSREAESTAQRLGRLPYSRCSFERVGHAVGARYGERKTAIDDADRRLGDSEGGAGRELRARSRVVADLEASGRQHVRVGEHRPVHEAMTSLRNQRELLGYAGARRRGLPIGTGATEATCKSLFTVRMKRRGARWKEGTASLGRPYVEPSLTRFLSRALLSSRVSNPSEHLERGMTGHTDRLIRRLAEQLEPVRPLPPPWVRTGAWLALAVPAVALIVLVVSPRDDLPSKMLDVRFVIEQAAALTTSITAAMAAFVTVVPGHNRKFLVLPLLPLALWVGSVGQRCVQDWLGRNLSLQPDWICLPVIVLAGAFPAFAMAVLLRRGVPLTPRATAALGGLAAAALANVGLRVLHPQDASVTVLVWQCGPVLGLSALAGCTGRCFLHWRAIGAGAHGRVVVR